MLDNEGSLQDVIDAFNAKQARNAQVDAFDTAPTTPMSGAVAKLIENPMLPDLLTGVYNLQKRLESRLASASPTEVLGVYNASLLWHNYGGMYPDTVYHLLKPKPVALPPNHKVSPFDGLPFLGQEIGVRALNTSLADHSTTFSSADQVTWRLERVGIGENAPVTFAGNVHRTEAQGMEYQFDQNLYLDNTTVRAFIVADLTDRVSAEAIASILEGNVTRLMRLANSLTLQIQELEERQPVQAIRMPKNNVDVKLHTPHADISPSVTPLEELLHLRDPVESTMANTALHVAQMRGFEHINDIVQALTLNPQCVRKARTRFMETLSGSETLLKGGELSANRLEAIIGETLLPMLKTRTDRPMPTEEASAHNQTIDVVAHLIMAEIVGERIGQITHEGRHQGKGLLHEDFSFRGLLEKVALIEYQKIYGLPYRASNADAKQEFDRILSELCGMLAKVHDEFNGKTSKTNMSRPGNTTSGVGTGSLPWINVMKRY